MPIESSECGMGVLCRGTIADKEFDVSFQTASYKFRVGMKLIKKICFRYKRRKTIDLWARKECVL
jgi:hypothetical protein